MLSVESYQPYADDPSNHGVFVVDPEWLLKAIIDADKAGLQVTPCFQLSLL